MSPDDVAECLAEARGGSREAIGQLWGLCWPYLLHIADQDLGPVLRRKVAPSDLVQQTFLEAQRDLMQFGGATERELLAWLRCILVHKLDNARQHYEAGKRQVGREEPGVNGQVPEAPGPGGSPSAQARARERAEAVERALQRLPEDARQAIALHLWQGQTFAQVGERLGRSEEAARKLYRRAAEELAPLLEPFRDDA
jgi:RNA polymerase sigma-70 factor (ECF subfamily)